MKKKKKRERKQKLKRMVRRKKEMVESLPKRKTGIRGKEIVRKKNG